MSEVAPLISDLAFILIVAGLVTVIFKWLKQPVILGYIVAGILAGPSVPFLPTVSDPANIKTWADIGVIFLLFAMGLDFSFKKLMNVGLTAFTAGITVVCGMTFLGYTAGNAMGFSHMSSIFLGGMLSMSSTAIVFKAFSDMGLLQQRFTGIVLGILVVEDLLAVVMMVLLSTLAVSEHFEGNEMFQSVLKLAAFLIFWSVLGIYLIPTLLRKIRQFINNETLLIMSIGLCLGMVMIATHAGFSAALGAFVMGSLLAETIASEKIVQVVQPVKDLFGAIFFVSVGMMVDPVIIWQYAIPILILTLLVLLGQVFFGSFGVLLSGQSLRIAIQSGFSLAQVGEFAFIIASLGVSLKVTDSYLYPVIVAVSVITTFLTPYMIRFSTPVYSFIDAHLPQFLKDSINRYTSGTMMVKHQSTWHKLLKSMLLSIMLYVVLCSFTITLFFTYIHPLIKTHLSGIEGNLLSFVLLSLLIAPFLWAIIMNKNNSTEFHELWEDNLFNRGALVSMILVKIILCIIIVMGVIIHLFNVASGVGLVLSLVLIGVIYFSKWIRKRSLTMEKQFMVNFEGSEEKNVSATSPAAPTFRNSSPFKNLHKAEFTIAPDFKSIGQTIGDTRIRTQFKINILSIKRGDLLLYIPNGNEHLYPYDKITVVGTDEQLAQFQTFLEQKNDQNTASNILIKNIDMEEITLEKDSSLIGKSIRQAGIQGCIIVGIERANGSLINPEPDTIFQEKDILWIVGDRKMIRGVN